MPNRVDALYYLAFSLLLRDSSEAPEAVDWVKAHPRHSSYSDDDEEDMEPEDETTCAIRAVLRRPFVRRMGASAEAE